MSVGDAYSICISAMHMRTTLDIDAGLLDEAVERSGSKSKKDAVEAALHAFVRDLRVQELRSMIGTHDINMTPDELDRFRGRDRSRLPG